VTDAWHAVKVREFEHVLVSPSVALLRVTGKAPRRRSADTSRPTLLADDGHTVKRVAAIPSPPDARGTLRAAYTVAADLIDSGSVFSLELDDGEVIALPTPTRGATRLAPKPRSSRGNAIAAAADRRADEERRTGMVTKLSELSAALAESERVRGRLRSALASARAESEQAGERTRALEARLGDLESRPPAALPAAIAPAADVDERVRAALSAAEGRAQAVLLSEQEQAQARIAALESEHAEVRERHEAQLAELAEAYRIRRAEVEMAHEAAMTDARHAHETELDRVKRSRDELERSLAAYIAEADARQELQSSVEQERGRAARVRDELETTKETVRRVSEERDELEAWRGDLERRLIGTTDELSQLMQDRSGEAGELLWLRAELAEAQARAELAEARVTALDRRLADARAQEARRLTEETAARAEPKGNGAGNGSPTSAEPRSAVGLVRSLAPASVRPPEAGDQALAVARQELETLRGELAATRDAASRERAEMLRRTAVAAAEEQAERELAQAASSTA